MVSILYGYVKVNSQAFPSFICVLMCTKFRVNLNLSFFINIFGNFLGFLNKIYLCFSFLVEFYLVFC